MKREMISMVLAGAVLAAGFSGCATEPRSAVPRSQISAVDQLDWLGGHWSTPTSTSGRSTQEHWTTPSSAGMFGIGRSLHNDVEVFFEYLRIAEVDGNVVYFASPNGRQPATAFAATSIAPDRVVFENPEHDFPQRIIYALQDDGTILASIEGTANGQFSTSKWILSPIR